MTLVLHVVATYVVAESTDTGRYCRVMDTRVEGSAKPEEDQDTRKPPVTLPEREGPAEASEELERSTTQVVTEEGTLTVRVGPGVAGVEARVKNGEFPVVDPAAASLTLNQ